MTSNRPRLLVTGFGPFPGIPRNPSAEIARRVAASPRWRTFGIATRCLILPTTYAGLDEHLEPVLASDAPDAVLMIGVAGRAKRVRVERRAVNRASILLPDAAGRRPDRLSLSDGPTARIGRASLMNLRAILRRHAVPCGISQDAGRYLCNAAYWRALAAPVPVVFIHIPKSSRAARRHSAGRKHRRTPDERLATALVDVALHLLAQRWFSGRGGAGSPLSRGAL